MNGSPARNVAEAARVAPERLDKWLWHARFFRSRSLATAAVMAGHVRVNGARVRKTAHPIRPGDTLTIAQGNRIRVIRVTATGQRRGPAEVAQHLYRDLDTSAPEPPEIA